LPSTSDDLIFFSSSFSTEYSSSFLDYINLITLLAF